MTSSFLSIAARIFCRGERNCTIDIIRPHGTTIQKRSGASLRRQTGQFPDIFLAIYFHSIFHHQFLKTLRVGTRRENFLYDAKYDWGNDYLDAVVSPNRLRHTAQLKAFEQVTPVSY